MITLSDSARDDLVAFFKNKPPSPIRVKVAPGGCMGPKLTLDLDEQRNFDEVMEIHGLTFVMRRSLLAQVGRMTIDTDYTGFKISSERQPESECAQGGDCGSCGTGQSGSCSC